MVTLVLVPSVHSRCSSRRPSLRRCRPMAQSWLFCAHCCRDFYANGRAFFLWPRRLFHPLLLHAQTPQNTRHHVVLQGSLSAAAQGQTPRHDAGPALRRGGAKGGGKRAKRISPDHATRATKQIRTRAHPHLRTHVAYDCVCIAYCCRAVCVSSVMSSVALRS
jgi:hypothetical protein